MAGLREGSTGEDVVDGIVVTPAIKVNQACQLFGVKGDEILAHSLQDKEYEAKYSWNREVRRTARKDVPLAKAAHDEEEERLQRERLHFLQNQSKLTEEDAELARQFDREEQLAKQRERLKQEVRDQEMAKRIQVMEIQEQGRPKVRRSRDDDDSERGSVTDGHPLGGSVIRMSSFGGFHLDPATEDGDDGLTEVQRKQLMMMQDEELALALQEHEQMRAVRVERSRVVARPIVEGYIAQPFVPVVIPVQQERPQLTAQQRRPSDGQIPQGSVRVAAGFSPPSSGQHHHQPTTRSPGPPTRPAPHAPAHQVRSDDAYLNPIRTTNTNDVSDKSVTMVTSVGKSEFFRTIPAAEARSAEPKSSSTNRSDSSAENNRTHSAQTSHKTSSQDSARKGSKRK